MKKLVAVCLLSLSLCSPSFASSHSSGHHSSTSHSRSHSHKSKKSHASQATAECNDGTLSYSKHHRGTCSHHGGVKSWK